MSTLEVPMEDGESPVNFHIDDDGYICMTDEVNDYEIAFSPFNWNAIVEFIDQRRRGKMS